jgi:hypothetical protein
MAPTSSCIAAKTMMKRILLWLLLLLSLALAYASAKEQEYDPQCRGVTSVDDDGVEVFTADVVLVGSGPAGAGFLHRLVRLRPDISVIWVEKGMDFKAINWPEDIVEDVSWSYVSSCIDVVFVFRRVLSDRRSNTCGSS